MGDQWFVFKNQQQLGPFSKEQFVEMAVSGEFGSEDLVWKEGMENWISAGQVEGLLPKTAASPPPPPSPGVVPPSFPGKGDEVKSSSHDDGGAVQPDLAVSASSGKKKKSGLKIAAIVLGSLLVLFVIMVIIGLSAGRKALRSSEVYGQAVSALYANPAALTLLGEPVEIGKGVNGEISLDNAMGEAELSIPVSGSSNKGQLNVTGVKSANVWSLSTAVLAVETGETINLLQPAPANNLQPELDFGSPGTVTGAASGMLTFEGQGFGFAMNYPDSWFYNIVDNSVYFFGPEDSEEGENMVVVQVLANASNGGQYASLDQIYSDLEEQYISLNGAIYDQDSGYDYIGDTEHAYIMLGAFYPYEGEDVLEIAIVIERDENYFYIILYTVPVEIGDKYADLVFEQIIDSFQFTAF